MPKCFFVSDLHGLTDRYEKLFSAIVDEKPAAVFMGGDILPSAIAFSTPGNKQHNDFLKDYLIPELLNIREAIGEKYPKFFIILGNDDGRYEEPAMQETEKSMGIWHYAHNRRFEFGENIVYGYSFVPPTPFMLKDWERYDISRYVDPGCVSPEDGSHSIEVRDNRIKFATIKEDLDELAGDFDLSKTIFLFHSPPHKTNLDYAALEGKMIDHIPLDPNVGSIAIRRFIEKRQPLVTLHGHIHESASLTGSWNDRIGETYCFSAAHDGPELALVVFDSENLDEARRDLI